MSKTNRNSGKNSTRSRNAGKNSKGKKNVSGIYIGACILILLIAVFTIIKVRPDTGGKSNTDVSPSGGDIVIRKDRITEEAEFIAYKAGNTVMEIFAVKAPDGTIRTALNTCQVCYDSGRGYYVQKGEEMVCQNCGNRFKISQIEKEKNGCNPVPITEDGKTDDGQTITISAEYIKQYSGYFADWKR